MFGWGRKDDAKPWWTERDEEKPTVEDNFAETLRSETERACIETHRALYNRILRRVIEVSIARARQGFFTSEVVLPYTSKIEDVDGTTTRLPEQWVQVFGDQLSADLPTLKIKPIRQEARRPGVFAYKCSWIKLNHLSIEEEE